MLTIKNNDEIRNVLGDNIKISGLFFPWVDGVVSPVKGIYDVEFKVHGDKDELSMKVVMTRVPNSGLWRFRYWTCTNNENKLKGRVVNDETGEIEFQRV